MIADFNKSWPEGVTRTRDVVTLVEEREGLAPQLSRPLAGIQHAAEPRRAGVFFFFGGLCRSSR